MKTIQVNLYTAQELKDQFPNGFRRAFECYQSSCNEEIPWQDETIGSLKTILDDAGIRLKNYSLGAYNRGNQISIAFPDDNAEEFTGRRAWAWLENNLLSKYRIPFVPATNPERKKRLGYMKSYSGCHPLGQWNYYAPGLIKPCPATGYCADESYLDSLRTSLRKGYTLREAFEGLADTCMELLEADDQDNRSEERFLENADGCEYTEDGRRN